MKKTRKKRIFESFLILLLASILLIGCSKQEQIEDDKDEQDSMFGALIDIATQPSEPSVEIDENEETIVEATDSQPSVSIEESFPDQQENDGLIYYLSDDGTYYNMYATGECKDTDVVVLGEYLGLPVRSVYFEGCANLTSVTILNGVTSLYEDAFNGCVSLTRIAIPATLTDIDDEAFLGCTSLEQISVSSENPKYCSVDECLIEKETNTLILGCKNSIIPSDGSVTRIGRNAFSGCTGLTSITIPGCVTHICIEAFSDCTSLENVTISDGVVHIQNRVFWGCSNLKNIVIPDSVIAIGSNAFANCTSLKSITIPESVTTINERLFSGCTSLESVKLHGNITVFFGAVFENCTSLESIVIPKSVSTILTMLFHGCSNLKNIYCEAESEPSDWRDSWQPDHNNFTIYWGDEWEYIDGEPTPKLQG